MAYRWVGQPEMQQPVRHCVVMSGRTGALPCRGGGCGYQGAGPTLTAPAAEAAGPALWAPVQR